jgi:NADH:ubiquinone oxidoreductase subunit C
MSDQSLIIENIDLSTRFPGVVVLDERKGYEGYLVRPENLLEFASFLRDEAGYDYLSSVTGVDYLPEGKMEVVYQFWYIKRRSLGMTLRFLR